MLAVETLSKQKGGPARHIAVESDEGDVSVLGAKRCLAAIQIVGVQKTGVVVPLGVVEPKQKLGGLARVLVADVASCDPHFTADRARAGPVRTAVTPRSHGGHQSRRLKRREPV